MSYFFKAWRGPITAQVAEREPMAVRLFAEEDAECTPSAGIKKPSIKNGRVNRSARPGLPLSSAACLNTSDSASYLRSLKKSPIKY